MPRSGPRSRSGAASPCDPVHAGARHTDQKHSEETATVGSRATGHQRVVQTADRSPTSGQAQYVLLPAGLWDRLRCDLRACGSRLLHPYWRALCGVCVVD